jgi:hypothetical protein
MSVASVCVASACCAFVSSIPPSARIRLRNSGLRAPAAAEIQSRHRRVIRTDCAAAAGATGPPLGEPRARKFNIRPERQSSAGRHRVADRARQ